MALTPIEQALGAAVLAQVEANSASIIAEINTVEGAAEAAIENFANEFKPAGLLGAVYPALKAPFIAELKKLEAANPGSVLFAILDAEAHKLLGV